MINDNNYKGTTNREKRGSCGFWFAFPVFFFVFDRVLLLIRFSLMLDEYTFLPSCVGQGPMEGFQTSLRKKRLGYPCLNRHIQRGG